MLRIAATLLVFLAWHGPTTFFVPSGPPHEGGWVVWPFGQQSRPVIDALVGIVAPDKVTTTGQPTVALFAARARVERPSNPDAACAYGSDRLRVGANQRTR